MGGDASVESRTLKVKIRDACSLVSPVMLFYVLAQFTCWTVHDAIQEWMFKQDGFVFGSFMAFGLQSACVVGSGLELLLQRESAPKVPAKREGEAGEPKVRVKSLEEEEDCMQRTWREALGSVPAHYAYLGLMIALSSSLANKSLNYVSQPVKVLFKSSKLVPVMAFRALVGNVSRNSWRDYAYAFMVCGGLTVFTMADHTRSTRAVRAELIGIVMLLISVCGDAMAPNLQEKLLRRFSQHKASLMLHTNWISAAMTLMYIIPSGEGYRAVLFLNAHPHAAKMLVAQSLAGGFGVAAYVGCIKYAGSKTTVLVTSTRKMFTIALSFLLITRQTFTPVHLMGLSMALAGMFGSGLEEADAKAKKRPPPPVAYQQLGAADDKSDGSGARVKGGPPSPPASRAQAGAQSPGRGREGSAGDLEDPGTRSRSSGVGNGVGGDDGGEWQQGRGAWAEGGRSGEARARGRSPLGGGAKGAAWEGGRDDERQSRPSGDDEEQDDEGEGGGDGKGGGRRGGGRWGGGLFG